MSLWIEVSIVLAAYLIGSVPVGYLLVRHFTGQNILEMGSGNMGSTNVRRVASRKIAVLTQLLDMAKGLLPVGVYLCLRSTVLGTADIFGGDRLFGTADGNMASDWLVYGVALASILGHDFSLFLKFKGGKGVNTTLGASVLLAPLPVFISVAVYFIVKWCFKYVSLGSIALAIAMVISEFLLYGVNGTFHYLLVCMVLILVLHYKNIGRLLRHQELLPR